MNTCRKADQRGRLTRQIEMNTQLIQILHDNMQEDVRLLPASRSKAFEAMIMTRVLQEKAAVSKLQNDLCTLRAEIVILTEV